MAGFCLFTNDVETTSIVNGGLSNATAKLVLEYGMPSLLDLYAKYNIKATFFFTADIAILYPNIVKMILPYGHEVASHGLTHDYKQAFDVLSQEEQISHLKESKKILEDISGKELVSFRAPALRVNEYTAKALLESGFKYDSSISPQRLDMFMSLGSKKKLSWITAPRTPYHTSYESLARKGNSPLIEVPISSFGVPYIGTFMRISPSINRMTRQLLYSETKNTNKAINFLIHPTELIDEPNLNTTLERRANSYLSYLFSDVLRKMLKQKNLGDNALRLFEDELIFWKNKQYECVTMREYVEKINIQ